jgi:hypothetical protein
MNLLGSLFFVVMPLAGLIFCCWMLLTGKLISPLDYSVKRWDESDSTRATFILQLAIGLPMSFVLFAIGMMDVFRHLS